MDNLANVDWGSLAAELETLQSSHELFIAAAAGSIVIGLLVGVFGLKLVRLLSAMVGVCIGAGIGLVAGVLLGMSDTVVLVMTLGGALILAVVFGIFKKVGMFIWIIFSMTGVVVTLAYQGGVIGLIVGMVLGVAIAIVSLKFFEPLVIIATSVVGGRSIAEGVLLLAGFGSSLLLNIIAFVVMAVICIAIQFGMQSRKIKKKEEGFAKEYREQESREKEIEVARMLLDDEE